MTTTKLQSSLYCQHHHAVMFEVLSPKKNRRGEKQYYPKHEEWTDPITYRWCTGDGVWKYRKQRFMSKEAEDFVLGKIK